MDPLFPPPLMNALDRLQASQRACPGRGWREGFRAARLRQTRHVRASRNAWLNTKRALGEAGVPLCPFRVGARWSQFPSLEVAYYGPQDNRVVMPSSGWRENFLPVDQACLAVQNVFVLLHEATHARLYQTHDLRWAQALPKRIREHADPVFQQLPGHPGWGVFNEMMADAFAAAWVLRLSHHHPEAVEWVAGLKHYRAQREHPRFLYFHDTSRVLDAILALPLVQLSDTAVVGQVVTDGFGHWLTNGGEALCWSHLETQLLSLRDNGAPRGLLAPPVARGTFYRRPELAPYVLRLQTEWPQHPIFRLSQCDSAQFKPAPERAHF